MNDIVTSYVIRIMYSDNSMNPQTRKNYRIKLSHVQSGEEIYLHSFEELKEYLEIAVTE